MSRFAILSLLIWLLVAGCSGDMPSKQVGKHTFSVPGRYLVRGTIPWLPVSQSDNLSFILNPGVPLKEQIVVLVQPAEETCSPSTEPVTNELESVCSMRPTVLNKDNRGLRKIFRNGDTTQWYYIGSDKNIVASCFAMADDSGNGLCSSTGRYNDLVFSFGIQESAIGKLDILHKEIGNLLSAWETRQDR